VFFVAVARQQTLRQRAYDRYVTSESATDLTPDRIVGLGAIGSTDAVTTIVMLSAIARRIATMPWLKTTSEAVGPVNCGFGEFGRMDGSLGQLIHAERGLTNECNRSVWYATITFR